MKDIELRALMAGFPDTIEVLYENDIDFACGGEDTLAKACVKAHVELERVMTDIQEVIAIKSESKTETNWAKESPENLIRHLLNAYHAPLPGLFRVLDALAENLMGLQKYDSEKVVKLRDLINAMSTEMMSHMAKEENILFPWIIRGGQDLSAPTRMMEHEHLIARDMIAQLNAAVEELQIGHDKDRALRAFLQEVELLDFELKMHIHIENNILFPKALNCSDRLPDYLRESNEL